MGIVLLVIGIIFLALSGWQLSRAYQTLKWPSAEGTVTKSMPIEYTVTEESGAKVKQWKHSLRYEFTVKGKVREGILIDLNKTTPTSRAWAERSAAKYPEGAKVAVFYNPSDLKECALNRGYSPMLLVLYIAILVGGAFALAAGMAMLSSGK